MDTLTEKQEAVLKFIELYQMNHGASPTIREIKEHFDVKSDNSILKHLKALQEKGYIEKDDTPRGIKLLESVRDKLQSQGIKVPLLGHIPAGGPVLSEEYIEDMIEISEDIAPTPEDCFMLRVHGQSMIDVGIFEGDIVIINPKKPHRSGDIVVALVDNENTLKRYMNEQGKIYLKAENAEYENIYPEHDLQIQGVVIGLLRYY